MQKLNALDPAPTDSLWPWVLDTLAQFGREWRELKAKQGMVNTTGSETARPAETGEQKADISDESSEKLSLR